MSALAAPLSSDDLRFLASFQSLELDPDTSGCRHLALYVGDRAGLPLAASIQAVTRLDAADILERDADSVGLAPARGSWRMRDQAAAERALGLAAIRAPGFPARPSPLAQRF